MTTTRTGQLDWTVRTVAFAWVAAVLGLLIALALREMGVWPAWDYSEVIFGGLCGATTVHRLHPGRPIVVVLVFVPVLAVLLLLGRVLFHLLILRDPIDL